MEPVLVARVSLLQYLERVPDRQAAEMLQYHAGWNFALNRNVGDPGFQPTVLVYFRRRLIQADQSGLIFRQVLEGLVEAGLRHSLSSLRDLSQIKIRAAPNCRGRAVRLICARANNNCEARDPQQPAKGRFADCNYEAGWSRIQPGGPRARTTPTNIQSVKRMCYEFQRPQEPG